LQEADVKVQPVDATVAIRRFNAASVDMAGEDATAAVYGDARTSRQQRFVSAKR
jgi:hypothetical protein